MNRLHHYASIPSQDFFYASSSYEEGEEDEEYDDEIAQEELVNVEMHNGDN